MLHWIIALLCGIVLFLVIGWFTGDSDEFGGVDTKDDERSKMIKQKAIVSSWVLLLIILITGFVFDFFNLNDPRLANIELAYPELLYLLVAVSSYFIYYWIYSRRLSSHEK